MLALVVGTFSPATRENPGPQWERLREDHPFGFDVVVEATGVESIAQDSINYVRRGGTLLVYGVYEDKARVSWPPSKIFVDEIRVYTLAHLHPILSDLHSDRLLGPSRNPTASRELLNTSRAERSRPREWYVLVTDLYVLLPSSIIQVTDVFKLEDYQKALDKMSSRSAVKIAIQP